MSESVWYYIEGEAQLGPVSREELVALLRQRLARETLVWRDGLGDWRPALEVAELGLRAPAPPPLAPPPAPMRARPSVRPSSTAAAPGAPRDEPLSYNPFVLWKRCLNFSGRFDRGEFAIAYLGELATVVVMSLGLGIVLALLAAPGSGRPSDGPPPLVQAALGAWCLLLLPFILVVTFGSVVRRLHDLGQTGWFALLMMLPCVNFLMVIYLLVVPSPMAQATGTSSSMPAIAIAAVVGSPGTELEFAL